MKPAWNRTQPKISWDCAVNEYRAKHHLHEIRPVLARSQNIGAEQGTWVPGAAWHRKFQYNPLWADSLPVPGGDFSEVSAGEKKMAEGILRSAV
jgi:hypothetical protein